MKYLFQSYGFHIHTQWFCLREPEFFVRTFFLQFIPDSALCTDNKLPGAAFSRIADNSGCTSDIVGNPAYRIRAFRMGQNQRVRMGCFCFQNFLHTHLFMNGTEAFIENKILFRNLGSYMPRQVPVRNKKDIFIWKRLYNLHSICRRYTYI